MTTSERRIRKTSGMQEQEETEHDAYNSIKLIPLHDLLQLQAQNHEPKMSSSAPEPPAVVPLPPPFGPVYGVTAWNYSVVVGASLVVWVVYLMFPKGVRKEFFGAYPKRFAKTTAAARKQGIGQWIYPTSTNGSSMYSMSRDNSSLFSGGATEKYLAELAYARKAHMLSMQDSREEQSTRDLRDESPLDTSFRNQSSYAGKMSPFMPSVASVASSFNQGRDRYDAGPAASVASNRTSGTSSWAPSWRPKTPQHMDSSVLPSIGELSKSPPSPKHPSINRPPNNTVISDTMMRLKERGIRLVAHGVQCQPKRVWIRLDDETMNLSWQTEFPRRVPTANGEGSIVLMRGSIHKIALPNVLYIDVGKKTNALQKPSSVAIPNTVCFSLLTQNGSLDLQTNSMLERDALVSCFSVLLDRVHQDRDWRALYEEGSSVVTGSEFMMNGMVEI
jgi:hypothetical protein